MERNKYGFTLVELIVVIVILGVILVMALPQISNIQQENKNKKYDSYKEAIEAAAKVYIDTHEEDLFGNQTTGCYTITYTMLKNDNLIKDFGEENIDCSRDDETLVYVTKDNNRYSYVTNITCRKDGEVVYKDNDSDGNPDGVCLTNTDPNGDPPELTIIPTNSSNQWYNAEGLVNLLNSNKGIRIQVSDSDGLNKNISVKWTWKNLSKGGSESYVHNFNNKASQITSLLSYKFKKKEVPRDSQDSGQYQLILEPNNKTSNYGVQDYFGNVRYTSISAQTYFIDNENPTLNPTISSKESSYHSLDVRLDIHGNDNVSVSKMYISNKGYETGGKWQNYQSSIDWKLDGDYDGKNRTVYITIQDPAGNKTNKSVTYKVYKYCTDKIQVGNWSNITSCSRSCGGGTLTQQRPLADEHFTGHSCGTTTQVVGCNTMDCCSKTTDKSGGYGACTSSSGCGTGTQYETIYKIGIDGRVCSTNSNANPRSCNTGISCVPTNTCYIRGSRLVYPPYGWSCSAGHWHYPSDGAYIHYCSDSNGNLIFKDTTSQGLSHLSGRVNASINTYNWICPQNPYGPAQGYTIISD